MQKTILKAENNGDRIYTETKTTTTKKKKKKQQQKQQSSNQENNSSSNKQPKKSIKRDQNKTSDKRPQQQQQQQLSDQCDSPQLNRAGKKKRKRRKRAPTEAQIERPGAQVIEGSSSPGDYDHTTRSKKAPAVVRESPLEAAEQVLDALDQHISSLNDQLLKQRSSRSRSRGRTPQSHRTQQLRPVHSNFFESQAAASARQRFNSSSLAAAIRPERAQHWLTSPICTISPDRLSILSSSPTENSFDTHASTNDEQRELALDCYLKYGIKGTQGECGCHFIHRQPSNSIHADTNLLNEQPDECSRTTTFHLNDKSEQPQSGDHISIEAQLLLESDSSSSSSDYDDTGRLFDLEEGHPQRQPRQARQRGLPSQRNAGLFIVGDNERAAATAALGHEKRWPRIVEHHRQQQRRGQRAPRGPNQSVYLGEANYHLDSGHFHTSEHDVGDGACTGEPHDLLLCQVNQSAAARDSNRNTSPRAERPAYAENGGTSDDDDDDFDSVSELGNALEGLADSLSEFQFLQPHLPAAAVTTEAACQQLSNERATAVPSQTAAEEEAAVAAAVEGQKQQGTNLASFAAGNLLELKRLGPEHRPNCWRCSSSPWQCQQPSAAAAAPVSIELDCSNCLTVENSTLSLSWSPDLQLSSADASSPLIHYNNNNNNNSNNLCNQLSILQREEGEEKGAFTCDDDDDYSSISSNTDNHPAHHEQNQDNNNNYLSYSNFTPIRPTSQDPECNCKLPPTAASVASCSAAAATVRGFYKMGPKRNENEKNRSTARQADNDTYTTERLGGERDVAKKTVTTVNSDNCAEQDSRLTVEPTASSSSSTTTTTKGPACGRRTAAEEGARQQQQQERRATRATDEHEAASSSSLSSMRAVKDIVKMSIPSLSSLQHLPHSDISGAIKRRSMAVDSDAATAARKGESPSSPIVAAQPINVAPRNQVRVITESQDDSKHDESCLLHRLCLCNCISRRGPDYGDYDGESKENRRADRASSSGSNGSKKRRRRGGSKDEADASTSLKSLHSSGDGSRPKSRTSELLSSYEDELRSAKSEISISGSAIAAALGSTRASGQTEEGEEAEQQQRLRPRAASGPLKGRKGMAYGYGSDFEQLQRREREKQSPSFLNILRSSAHISHAWRERKPHTQQQQYRVGSGAADAQAGPTRLLGGPHERRFGGDISGMGSDGDLLASPSLSSGRNSCEPTTTTTTTTNDDEDDARFQAQQLSRARSASSSLSAQQASALTGVGDDAYADDAGRRHHRRRPQSACSIQESVKSSSRVSGRTGNDDDDNDDRRAKAAASSSSYKRFLSPAAKLFQRSSSRSSSRGVSPILRDDNDDSVDGVLVDSSSNYDEKTEGEKDGKKLSPLSSKPLKSHEKQQQQQDYQQQSFFTRSLNRLSHRSGTRGSLKAKKAKEVARTTGESTSSSRTATPSKRRHPTGAAATALSGGSETTDGGTTSDLDLFARCTSPSAASTVSNYRDESLTDSVNSLEGIILPHSTTLARSKQQQQARSTFRQAGGPEIVLSQARVRVDRDHRSFCDMTRTISHRSQVDGGGGCHNHQRDAFLLEPPGSPLNRQRLRCGSEIGGAVGGGGRSEFATGSDNGSERALSLPASPRMVRRGVGGRSPRLRESPVAFRSPAAPSSRIEDGLKVCSSEHFEKHIGNIRVNQLEAQKHLFKAWINHFCPNLIRHDLVDELKDGIKLIGLLAALTGDRQLLGQYERLNRDKQSYVNRIAITPSSRLRHLSNVSIAIEYLRRGCGMRLVNLNPMDIVSGKPNVILGLCWNIILNFQLEQNFLRYLDGSSSSTSGEEIANGRGSSSNSISIHSSAEVAAGRNSPCTARLAYSSTSEDGARRSNSKSIVGSTTISTTTGHTNSSSRQQQELSAAAKFAAAGEDYSTSDLVAAKKKLLNYINKQFNLKLTNLTSSLLDGDVMLVIIKHLISGQSSSSSRTTGNEQQQPQPQLQLTARNSDGKSWIKMDDDEKLDHCFELAQQHLNVPRLFRASDLRQQSISDNSSKPLLVYLSMLLNSNLTSSLTTTAAAASSRGLKQQTTERELNLQPIASLDNRRNDDDDDDDGNHRSANSQADRKPPTPTIETQIKSYLEEIDTGDKFQVDKLHSTLTKIKQLDKLIQEARGSRQQESNTIESGLIERCQKLKGEADQIEALIAWINQADGLFETTPKSAGELAQAIEEYQRFFSPSNAIPRQIVKSLNVCPTLERQYRECLGTAKQRVLLMEQTLKNWTSYERARQQLKEWLITAEIKLTNALRPVQSSPSGGGGGGSSGATKYDENLLEHIGQHTDRLEDLIDYFELEDMEVILANEDSLYGTGSGGSTVSALPTVGRAGSAESLTTTATTSLSQLDSATTTTTANDQAKSISGSLISLGGSISSQVSTSQLQLSKKATYNRLFDDFELKCRLLAAMLDSDQRDALLMGVRELKARLKYITERRVPQVVSELRLNINRCEMSIEEEEQSEEEEEEDDDDDDECGSGVLVEEDEDADEDDEDAAADDDGSQPSDEVAQKPQEESGSRIPEKRLTTIEMRSEAAKRELTAAGPAITNDDPAAAGAPPSSSGAVDDERACSDDCEDDEEETLVVGASDDSEGNLKNDSGFFAAPSPVGTKSSEGEEELLTAVPATSARTLAEQQAQQAQTTRSADAKQSSSIGPIVSATALASTLANKVAAIDQSGKLAAVAAAAAKPLEQSKAAATARNKSSRNKRASSARRASSTNQQQPSINKTTQATTSQPGAARGQQPQRQQQSKRPDESKAAAAAASTESSWSLIDWLFSRGGDGATGGGGVVRVGAVSRHQGAKSKRSRQHRQQHHKSSSAHPKSSQKDNVAGALESAVGKKRSASKKSATTNNGRTVDGDTAEGAPAIPQDTVSYLRLVWHKILRASRASLSLNIVLLICLAGICLVPLMQRDACCELSNENHIPIDQLSISEKPA